MSIAAHHLKPENMDLTVHPLIRSFESKLSELIGVLSKFIVTKQCTAVLPYTTSDPERSIIQKISKGIINESSVLIGDIQARTLEKEFLKITEEYFKEEVTNER